MSIVFVPLYIRFLGAESFGLVGIYVTVQAVLVLLDFGLSATASRELARLSRQEVGGEGARLVKTLEVVFWGTAAALVLLSWLAAPLASSWLQPDALAHRDVLFAVGLMGLAVAVQWPTTLYTGSLQGLQHQISVNVLAVAAATLRGAGAVLILWLVSPTITAFFLWHVAVGLTHTLAARTVMWRRIDARGHALDWWLLRRHWRFASGVAAIYALSLVLTQLDKVVLSRMLSLESFGYYALASLVAASLYRVVAPVVGAVYPRFTQLWSLGMRSDLVRLYHLGCQTVTVCVVPIVVVLALFPAEILWAWTRDAGVVEATTPLLRVLVIGVALNSVMTVPLALQLAHGQTRLIAISNLVAGVVLVPSLIFAARDWGAMGAAIVWTVVNCGYLLIVGYIVHRRLLPADTWRWFIRDLSVPTAACLIAVLPFRMGIPGSLSAAGLLLWLALAVLAALAAAVLSAPAVRALVFGYAGSVFRALRSGDGPRSQTTLTPRAP